MSNSTGVGVPTYTCKCRPKPAFTFGFGFTLAFGFGFTLAFGFGFTLAFGFGFTLAFGFWLASGGWACTSKCTCKLGPSKGMFSIASHAMTLPQLSPLHPLQRLRHLMFSAVCDLVIPLTPIHFSFLFLELLEARLLSIATLFKETDLDFKNDKNGCIQRTKEHPIIGTIYDLLDLTHQLGFYGDMPSDDDMTIAQDGRRLTKNQRARIRKNQKIIGRLASLTSCTIDINPIIVEMARGKESVPEEVLDPSLLLVIGSTLTLFHAMFIRTGILKGTVLERMFPHIITNSNNSSAFRLNNLVTTTGSSQRSVMGVLVYGFHLSMGHPARFDGVLGTTTSPNFQSDSKSNYWIVDVRHPNDRLQDDIVSHSNVMVLAEYTKKTVHLQKGLHTYNHIKVVYLNLAHQAATLLTLLKARRDKQDCFVKERFTFPLHLRSIHILQQLASQKEDASDDQQAPPQHLASQDEDASDDQQAPPQHLASQEEDPSDDQQAPPQPMCPVPHVNLTNSHDEFEVFSIILKYLTSRTSTPTIRFLTSVDFHKDGTITAPKDKPVICLYDNTKSSGLPHRLSFNPHAVEIAVNSWCVRHATTNGHGLFNGRVISEVVYSPSKESFDIAIHMIRALLLNPVDGNHYILVVNPDYTVGDMILVNCGSIAVVDVKTFWRPDLGGVIRDWKKASINYNDHANRLATLMTEIIKSAKKKNGYIIVKKKLENGYKEIILKNPNNEKLSKLFVADEKSGEFHKCEKPLLLIYSFKNVCVNMAAKLVAPPPPSDDPDRVVTRSKKKPKRQVENQDQDQEPKNECDEFDFVFFAIPNINSTEADGLLVSGLNGIAKLQADVQAHEDLESRSAYLPTGIVIDYLVSHASMFD